MPRHNRPAIGGVIGIGQCAPGAPAIGGVIGIGPFVPGALSAATSAATATAFYVDDTR